NRNTLLVELLPANEAVLTIENGNPVLKNKNASINTAIAHDVEIESPTYQGFVILTERDASTLLTPVDPHGITAFFLNGKGANDSNGKNIIDQVVAEGQVALQERVRRQKDLGQLGNFIKNNNLDYVNLKTQTSGVDPL